MELTRSAPKAAAYATDTYYREGLASWRDENVLWGTGLVVLKPDAVVGRRAVRAVRALADIGMRPCGVRQHVFTRHSMRELWRFQLNQATHDRLAVIDRLLPATPSLVLLVTDTDPLTGVPGSVRLSAAKGPADPLARRPHDLRHRLDAGPTLYNFLHTADEPADVVRELCVLFDDATRAAMVASATARADATDEALRVAAELESSVPAHDLDFAASARRLVAAARAAGVADAERAVDDVCAGTGGWAPVAAAFAGVPHDPWDVTTLAVHTIEHNEPGVPALVPPVVIARWQERVLEGQVPA